MDEIQRGEQAQTVLNDPLVIEALDGIEEIILTQWQEAKETTEREELWYTLQGAKRFRNYLTIVKENGEFEKAQLEKLNGE